MSRSSDSESSDSDRGIRYKTESTRCRTKTKGKHSSCRERPESTQKSTLREKSKHKSKKHGKKRYSNSSDDESSRSKKRKYKEKDEREPKKQPSKKKHKKEKNVDISDSESTDNSLELTRGASQVSSCSSNRRVIGPVMPDHSKCQTEDFDESKIIGPVLPSNLNSNQHGLQSTEGGRNIGPMLPSHSTQAMSEQPQYSNEPQSIGPMLPSHSTQSTSEQPQDSNEPRSIGPMLPPHLREKQTEDIDKSSEKIIGPMLPPHLRDTLLNSEEISLVSPTIPAPMEQISTESVNDDSEEEVYGPLPVGTALSKAHIELEERALQMQIDKLGAQGNNEPTREEWMTELPAAKAANFGLGHRQFRTKAGPDLSDRSSWTDTPQDKANKKLKKAEPEVDYKKEAELNAIRNRDREQEAIIKKIKRIDESLVDMHTKKMKKKEESGPVERRPFSRDIDLQVNRFDEAQKKVILKKAQLLDTRFSSGESKYL